MILPKRGSFVTINENLRTRYSGRQGKVVLLNGIEYGVAFGKANKVDAWFLGGELTLYEPKFTPLISFNKSLQRACRPENDYA